MFYSRDTKIHGSPSYTLQSLWHGKLTINLARSPANSFSSRHPLCPADATQAGTLDSSPPNNTIFAPQSLHPGFSPESLTVPLSGVAMTKSSGTSLTFGKSCQDRKGTEKALVLDPGTLPGGPDSGSAAVRSCSSTGGGE